MDCSPKLRTRGCLEGMACSFFLAQVLLSAFAFWRATRTLEFQLGAQNLQAKPWHQRLLSHSSADVVPRHSTCFNGTCGEYHMSKHKPVYYSTPSKPKTMANHCRITQQQRAINIHHLRSPLGILNREASVWQVRNKQADPT